MKHYKHDIVGGACQTPWTSSFSFFAAGKSAKTAMWAINVGNEYGQVIMSVLTTSETHGLANMKKGLCRRYHVANVPAPGLLYVNRDCCGSSCLAKYFSWSFHLVRYIQTPFSIEFLF